MKTYGIDGWDGSRRSWTGDPDDGSSIEVISEEPFQALITTPRHWHEPDPEPEQVGYGKPPRQHRFQPGQSGNPKGRPRGSKNKRQEIDQVGPRFKELIRAEADRTITLREGDGPLTLTMTQAIVRRVALDAAKGQPRAQKLFLELVGKMEADDERLRWEHFRCAVDRKREGEEEIARRKAQGITDISDIVPHPDDVIIHARAGQAEIVGPFTPEEKAAWKTMLARRHALQTLIAEETAKLARLRNPERRAATRESIEAFQQMLAQLEATLPPWVERQE